NGRNGHGGESQLARRVMGLSATGARPAGRPDSAVRSNCRSPWLNPTQLGSPAFLMNFPFSYATDCANNPWMKELKGEKRPPNFVRAAVQFLEVYRTISASTLVYVLPTPRGVPLQDLVYTANLGIVLDHLPDKNTVVISNFSSAPRRDEAPL